MRYRYNLRVALAGGQCSIGVMGASRQNIETLAARFRARGLHRVDQRDLERRLSRRLTSRERRALAIARDSRSHRDDTRTRDSESYRLAGAVRNARMRPTPIEGDINFRFDLRDARAQQLPERSHNLRARYTDVPDHSGNKNEKRLARIVAGKMKDRDTLPETLAEYDGVSGRVSPALAAAERRYKGDT